MREAWPTVSGRCAVSLPRTSLMIRSDTRAKLREFFEIDRHYVVLSALRALADEGMVPAAKVGEAIRKYGIDPNKPNPATV